MNNRAGDATFTSTDAEVILYTDGACSGNPGPGGWAYILEHPHSGKIVEASGADRQSTNNRMELQAVIEGLARINRRTRVHVVTDSSYVQKGVTEWIDRWKACGWKRKTSSGMKPIKNRDLWEDLDRVRQEHHVTFQRVRGHSGHPMNERCDELAVAAYQQLVAKHL